MQRLVSEEKKHTHVKPGMKNQGCARPHLWRQNPPHIEKTRGFIPILMNINKYVCIYIYIFVLNWPLTIS